MRLFVSVDLDDDLADAVAAAQEPLRETPGLSLTDPGQAHLTLKFLGEVSSSDLSTAEAALREGVDAAGVDPFEMTVEGFGVFPALDYIQVVWLGVPRGGGATELTTLHEGVESTFVDAGFDPADHDFTPHVTVARMDHAGGKEHVQEVVREGDPTVGTMRVEEVRLKESVRDGDGPTYETVARARLD
ncbi:MAG: RNA 2',3'-cyclic phosphodiesterase [Halobacteriaceae archaeon]